MYDLRNLFQINVEEGRHLWAMVYLLHKHFDVAEDERLVEFLRGGFGDAIVSDGAPGRLVALALSLAGPELADLPRIWALLSQHPAEIMRLSDRGRLDQGCRADLVVVARDSGAVEATISAGRLIHLTGQARDRFAAVLPRGRDDMGIAAE